MKRMQLRRPAALRARPIHATRAVAHDAALEYSNAQPSPRWLVIGTGVLGALAAMLLVVGITVLA